MTQQGDGQQATQKRRKRQTGETRGCRIAISVNEEEHQELEIAARENRLTVSAFVADRALAAARRQAPKEPGPLREAMRDFNHATAQLQRTGTLLNQAVAAFNATGQPPGNLLQYARYTANVAYRVKQAADDVQRRLP